jgi:dTDP-glucose 4,6-dehydratase
MKWISREQLMATVGPLRKNEYGNICWLYALDHCKGIDIVYHIGKSGQSYNIGGRNERENLYISRIIGEILDRLAPETKKGLGIGSYTELITFVADRPGHDRRYAIDASKIESELGWKAEEDFESGILKTVKWYLKEIIQWK